MKVSDALSFKNKTRGKTIERMFILMKKKFLYTLFLTIIAFSLTGCVKYNANMNINKDKSMDFSIIYALDTSVFGEEEILSSEQKEELEQKGYTIKEYSEGKMKGVTISLKIKNIDEISSENDEKYSLSGMFEETSNENMFKVKKGLLKNKYTATFAFNASDSGLTTDDSEFDDETDTILDDDWDNYIDEEIDSYADEDLESEESDSDFDLSGLTDSMSNMDLSFNVNLPYSAISNNATTANNDNKSLSWSLTSDAAESINFEFELYNMTNICIIAGSALLLIIIIIIIAVISKKKRNKEKNTVVDINDNMEPITPITPINSINEQAETIEPNVNQPEIVNMEQSPFPTNNFDMQQEIINPVDVNNMESNTVEIIGQSNTQPTFDMPAEPTMPTQPEPIEQNNINAINFETENNVQPQIQPTSNTAEPTYQQPINNMQQTETNSVNNIFGEPLNNEPNNIDNNISNN